MMMKETFACGDYFSDHAAGIKQMKKRWGH
jgi:hypothetical protein